MLGEATKPPVFVMLGGAAPVSREVDKQVQAIGVSFFRSPERALRAMAHVSLMRSPKARPISPRAANIASVSRTAGSGILVEHAGKAILADIGVTVPQDTSARTPEEAVAIAKRLDWPVVLKVRAAVLPHKTEVSGDLIGIATQPRCAGVGPHPSGRGGGEARSTLDGLLFEANAARGIEFVVRGRNDLLWGRSTQKIALNARPSISSGRLAAC